MTMHNPASGNTPALPTLLECQDLAGLLAGMIEEIDLMTSEGELFDNARIAKTAITACIAIKLADDLDMVKS